MNLLNAKRLFNFLISVFLPTKTLSLIIKGLDQIAVLPLIHLNESTMKVPVCCIFIEILTNYNHANIIRMNAKKMKYHLVYFWIKFLRFYEL